MDTKPLIYERISKCISEVEAVGKNGKNQSQGYSFRSIDDFYDAMQPVLSRNRVFVAPTILEHTREQRTTAKGGFVMTTLTKVRFKIFTEDGSFIEADALGEGADSGDKSANKAAAGAMKYLFMNVFAVRVNGESHDSERESHDYMPTRTISPPESSDVEEPQTPTPTVPAPTKTRGELLQNILTVLCPTVELQTLVLGYLRKVPSPSGRILLQPNEDFGALDVKVLNWMNFNWMTVIDKVEAWAANQNPAFQAMHAAVENPPIKLDWRVAVLPFVPADPTKTHLAGLTLQKLFDADSKWAFGVAMNYKAFDADATDADRHFEACCQQWRKEKGK